MVSNSILAIFVSVATSTIAFLTRFVCLHFVLKHHKVSSRQAFIVTLLSFGSFVVITNMLSQWFPAWDYLNTYTLFKIELLIEKFNWLKDFSWLIWLLAWSNIIDWAYESIIGVIYLKDVPKTYVIRAFFIAIYISTFVILGLVFPFIILFYENPFA